MTQREIQHLYWRAGFGILPKDLEQLKGQSKEQIVNSLFNNSKTTTKLTQNLNDVKNILASKELSKNEKVKQIVKLSKQHLKNYNTYWVKRLISPKEELRERMTLFWANHFVIKDNNILFVEQYNNTLREHALGDFRTFVKAISKQPAMLKYLNTRQNRKNHPNENFARELLELFTLGIGNYTETDIKQTARAFTGYNLKLNGDFVQHMKFFDDGQKTFLGKKGNFNGDDIIDIILSKRQCAYFICKKIYTYFVNDKPNKEHINQMTDVFFKNYNISNLMHYVFTSQWFYNEQNIGAKIKSPIDLLVGISRLIPIKFNNQKELYRIQILLGQTLLNPPNVAGWKGGKDWINTNTLMLRVKLPSMMLEKESFTIKPKGSFTAKNFRFVSVKNKYQNKLNVYVNWKPFRQQVKGLSLNELQSHLILCNLSSGAQAYIKSLGRRSSKWNFVRLISLPEYQMC